ncbi:hypothetical protein DFH06DRAFT_474341 [Mycena polygramma]|nr:hypothetical protein DFH06DRAFT_474341 [Mycena polygramma]
MSSSPSETDPLLPRAPTPRVASFIWLLPVVAFASICRGMSMFARYDHYQKTFCPGAGLYPCGFFSEWLELPSITVRIQMWGAFASFMVSFVSIGWWSELGDRRGRKIVLFCSILGAVFLNLMYLIVASTSPSEEDVRDTISVGLIVEGLLGGFAAYNGVVHAYAFDVSATPLARPVLFAQIDALSLVGLIVGAVIGKFTPYTVAFALSVVFSLANLAFIYTLLPESLKRQETGQTVIPQRSVLKSIVSPISVFFRGTGSSKYLLLYGLAFYTYSLTSAADTYLLRYTYLSSFLPHLPRWLLLVGGRVLSLTSLLCIVPVIAWLFQRKYGATERGGLRLATALSQNSILIAAISCAAVIVFCFPVRSELLYAVFTPLYPLATAVAAPALYALGASYFVAQGRTSEIGSLFGALAIWGALGEYISYSWYDAGSAVFWFSGFFLLVTLMFLLPEGPALEDEEIAPAAAAVDGV